MEENDNDEVSATAWQDTLFSTIMAVVFLFLAVLASVSAKHEEQAKAATPPGNLSVMITWPKGNSDVDLWLYGPKESRPVGYSDKAGVQWNLLRDDIGDLSDTTPLNYENAYTRGLSPGEYVINVHAYRLEQAPIKVTVEVDMNRSATSSTIVLFQTDVVLRRPNQEVTALRFRLDDHNRVVPGSVNHIFKPLREMWENS